MRRDAERGMTLIEIMVVITILGLIAAAVGVAVVPQLNKAKKDKAALDIKSLESGLKLYYTQKGKYPDTSEGLNALVTGKQIEALPKDPWGHDYVYTLEGGSNYTITSYGGDGAPGGTDDDEDISNKSIAATKP
jgi:general secretion pathway protein G